MKRLLCCIFCVHFGFLCSAENSVNEEAAAVFYIVRHGQTDWNVERRLQGHADIPLNEAGRAQAVELKEKLEGIDFTYCFSSDLQRASETARILLEPCAIAVQCDMRLRERNFGPWEGVLHSEYQDSLNQQESSVESDAAIQKRALPFFMEIADQHPDAHILVVTHAGVMRNLLALCYSIAAPTDIHVENMALVQLKVVHGRLEVQDLQGVELPSIDEV